MRYTILSNDLHETADLTEYYLKSQLGLRNIRIEEELPYTLSYTPSFWAENNDHNIICVEVSNQAYSRTLDHIILECQRLAYPIKLYYAIPKDDTDTNYRKNLSDARKRGVGVLELDTDECYVSSEALSLSLTGLRPINVKEFPRKYRELVNRAIATFRNGDPSKGCSILYDEVEAITRKIAIKTANLNWWTPSPDTNLERLAWFNICDLLRNKIDYGNYGKIGLRNQILKIHAIINERNDSGHKPRNKTALRRRDQRLRTRFEGLIDTMLDVINESKSLRI